MSSTVFFSWQADTPTRGGRNFVERALHQAAGRISDDTTIEDAIRELTVDRDTKGIPGSPPIVETIFRKIDKAAVFVPDLTFVSYRADGRPTPNPNVLIEYGWALKSLGHGRIVPVMNTAFGQPSAETMPFNLHHLRHPILYHCPVDASDETRKQTRLKLARQLEDALRAVLTGNELANSRLGELAAAPFPAHASEDGPGRFRASGKPLGVNDGRLFEPAFEVRLAEGPVIWFRVMPELDPVRTWSVADLKKIATGTSMLTPLDPRCSALWWVRNDDGFGVYATRLAEKSDEACSVVFAFKTGEVWAIDALLLSAMVHDGHKFIPDIEEFLKNKLISYTKFLTEIGTSPPYKWVAGMEDLKNRALYTRGGAGSWPLRAQGLCLRDILVAEGLYSPAEQPQRSLMPFFTELFDACGSEWPEFHG